jgi:hypothetical protein
MIGGDFCERQVRNVIVNGKWELIEKKFDIFTPKLKSASELIFNPFASI